MKHLFNAIRRRVPKYCSKLRNEIKREGILRAICKCFVWANERRRIFDFEKVTPLKSVPVSACFERGDNPRIAVQIHCFYPEVLPELLSYVNRIPYRFDCYVSTDTEEKKKLIEQILSDQCHAVSSFVQCFPNRGRDIAPMLLQLPAESLQKYDYLLHLHSKKSKHDDFGRNWMLHLLHTLLNSSGYIAAILEIMEQRNYGMVFQTTYYMVKPALGWHGNKENCANYLSRLGIVDKMPNAPMFPAGNMFWAKTDAVMPVFAHGFTAEDFPQELGQVDGTMAHCIERSWGIVVKAQGYDCLRVKPAARENENGKAKKKSAS